ncbi:MAG: ACT domain-containing protein [Thermoplasmatota archaeon]
MSLVARSDSVTARVRDYVASHAVVRDCLAMDLANLSALRRRICEEESIDHPDAVLSALRRIRKELSDPTDASLVNAHLAESRLEVRTGVGTLSFHPDWVWLGELANKIAALPGHERVHLYHGWEALLVVGEEAVLDDLVQMAGRNPPFERQAGLAEINVQTPDPLADVPGFIAHVSSNLARRGIRIVDLSTCRRDHVFLIEESDLPEALAALQIVTES